MKVEIKRPCGAVEKIEPKDFETLFKHILIEPLYLPIKISWIAPEIMLLRINRSTTFCLNKEEMLQYDFLQVDLTDNTKFFVLPKGFTSRDVAMQYLCFHNVFLRIFVLEFIFNDDLIFKQNEISFEHKAIWAHNEIIRTYPIK